MRCYTIWSWRVSLAAVVLILAVGAETVAVAKPRYRAAVRPPAATAPILPPPAVAAPAILIPPTPAKPAPVGGDLFPVVGLPPAACLVTAPALGSDAAPAGAIDGRTIKSFKALARLRNKAPKGTLFVTQGDFSGQKLGKAKLSDICFVGTKLSLTDWSQFSGDGIGFIDTDLTGAKFIDARMRYSLFRNATLAQVDATRADFSFSRLDGGWKGSMRSLRLDGAQLVGFRVECGVTAIDGCPVDRQGLSLKGANLAKASFYPFYFPDVDVTDAVLDQTEVGVEHLARLKGVKLLGPIIVRSYKSAAIFLPAELGMLRRSMLSGGIVDAASFDCTLARTVVQRVICTAPGSELRRLDREVAGLDRVARGESDRTSWLMSRDRCALEPEDEIAECLRTAYRSRRDALSARAGPPAWLAPGTTALFVSSDAPLTREFLQSELFTRIRPVIFDTAQARAMLRVDANGTIDAKGTALGNCRLSASSLTFDRKSGWVTGGGTVAKRGRAGVAGIPVLQGLGDGLRVYRDGVASQGGGSGYVQCGENGSFVPMQRVDLPSNQLAELWATF